MHKPLRFPTRLPALCVLAYLSLIPSITRAVNLENDRKHAAEQLALEIRRMAVHHIYVQDFLDTNGQRAPTGVFFAATFSKYLNEFASDFSVISRVEAHKFLDHSGWTDNDLSTNAVFAKFTSEFKPDAILHGIVSLQDGKYSIEFAGQDLTGKELFRDHYQEMADPSLVAWLLLAPTSNQSGRIYYFPGLDGVTIPKTTYSPFPPYTSNARRDKVSGLIDLSAIVTVKGKTKNVEILKKLYPELDAASIASLKISRFDPAKDPDGKPIPVRIQFQISFRLY
jgi:hypothetical protein